MSRPKFLTPKFVECALRYVIYFLAVALTPFLAKPIAPLFDWAGYSLMRPMFVEIFTVIFWGLEWLIIFLVERRLRKKKKEKKERYLREVGAYFMGNTDAKESALPKEHADAIGAHFMAQAQHRPLSKAEEKELIFQASREKNAKGKKKFKIRPPLPFKNVLLLTAISIVCIFIISAVTGFQVKPIYDIGEKVTGYEMYNKVSMLGRNVFKCFWILGMVKACKGMADELVLTSSLPENKRWISWLIEIALLLVFGVFDVFTSVMVYPLTLTRALVGATYILFYVAFVAVHALTEGSDLKAFLIIVLIYLF